MFNKLIIIIVISFLHYSQLKSQTPSYYHYTSSDGLASSTVFQIIQDRNDFIWFATYNGISKFDGKRFTSYRTNEGLNSNSIISLAEGNKGELYIGNYEQGINVLRNGKIENYCSEINGKSFSTSYLLLVPSNKNEQKIYAYKRYGAINTISETKGVLVANIYHTSPLFVNKLELLDNNVLLALTTKGIFNFDNNKLTRVHVNNLPDTNVYCLANYKDGSYLVGTKGMIYRIKENKVIDRFKINITGNNLVNAILIDSNNNIWFSVMNKGFYLIPRGSGKIIDIGSKMDLQNSLVNNYLEDNEGNIWISTFGKGVYCLNNLFIKSLNENDGLSSNNIYSIVKEKSGKLFIGTFNGINILENGRFNQIKSNSNETLTEYIHRIKNINNDFYVSASISGNKIINVQYKGIQFHMFDLPSFYKTSNGLYIFGTNVNSIIVQREFNYNKKGATQLYIFEDSFRLNRVNEIFEDSQNNIWVGTNYGLCKLTDVSEKSGKIEWKKSFYSSNPVLNSKIVSIVQDSENNIWFAGEKGIVKYNLTNDSITSYITINGHDLASSTSIISERKNRIWIGNMNGLYLFDGKSIKHLNKQTGLPSDEVYSLFFDKETNYLYIGTSYGLSVLDIKLFDQFIPHKVEVKINKVIAGDSVYTSYDNLVFEPEQSNILIDFIALSFSSPGSVKYKYNLNGIWTETDNDFLNFNLLKHGIYELQIIAKSQNADWSKPYLLKFSVLPRFYETIWFILLIISFLVFFSISIVARRLILKNKKIRNELELTERINELKHQALSAMMNPHFIFNSLNSVQFLVNSERLEEANDYIAMMAKLMRKNLDTAGSGFILLSEEINRLQLYLDLEKLRFQEKFTYEIITGKDVDPNIIMIPNMIIQPFVENSLWHGIINSDKKGLLTVSFSFEDVDIDSMVSKSLIIKITDNGIGINAAKKNKKDDHISKGILIIEERLKLLSTKMELPKPIMLEDLSNHNKNSHGTEVIISLPPPLYKISLPE